MGVNVHARGYTITVAIPYYTGYTITEVAVLEY